MRPFRTTRADALLLAGAFLLALAVRLLPFPAATAGGLRLASPDCYAHLRRSTAVARHFPRVPVRDPWLNHPDGGIFVWPPLFDLAVGGTARLAFGADATQGEVARVLAVVPPLLGAFHVVPLFLLARRVLSRRRATLAVCGYALLPAAALWSQYGHGDQHVAEALLLLLLLLALVRAAEDGLPPRRRVARAAVAGLALAAAILNWQGAVFAAALAFLWAALALPAAAAVAFALSSTALAALGTLPWAYGLDLPFSFVSFGWFQPALLLAGSAAVAAIAALRAAGRARRGLLALAILLGCAVAPVAVPLASSMLLGSRYAALRGAGAPADEMRAGGHVSLPPDVLAIIGESRHLLGTPLLPSLRSAVEAASPGLLLLPVALFFWARSRRRDRRLLALFLVALSLMTLSQARYVYYLAPFSALALAEGLCRVVPRRLLRRTALLATAVVLLVVPAGLPLYRGLAAAAGGPDAEIVAILSELRRLDPPPVLPDAFPPPAPGSVEGVFAPWALGHYVTALTGRPAASDPFLYGWRRQARLYTTPDAAEVEAILRASRCRWLVTTDLRHVFAAYAGGAGRPGARPEDAVAVRAHEGGSRRPAPFLELALDTRSAILGPGGRLVPRLRIFRVLPPSTPAPRPQSAPSP